MLKYVQSEENPDSKSQQATEPPFSSVPGLLAVSALAVDTSKVWVFASLCACEGICLLAWGASIAPTKHDHHVC